MSFSRKSLALLVAALSGTLCAQSAAPSASPANSVSGTLRPVLAQVGHAVGGVSTRRWKAPNEVKSATDQDVFSIQRDLNGTLAGLIQQADAAPGSVPAVFAVYRNVDALYDTLLRVVLTANLAAPDNEAESLQAALSGLEGARTSLGESILNASQAQQAELMRVRTALARAATTQSAPVKTTVVNDGPAPETRHRKSSTKKTTKPANSTNGPSTPQ